MGIYSNRPAVLLGVLWTETGLATLFTITRFYARFAVEPRAGWDDWAMLLALVGPPQCLMANVNLPVESQFLEYAATSILTQAVHFGLGKHQSTLNPENASRALEFQWIYQPVQVTSTIISRISVAILVIRLFPTKMALRKFLIILTAFNAVVGILAFTVIFTQCSPSRKLWDDKVAGHCISSNVQRDLAIFKACKSIIKEYCAIGEVSPEKKKAISAFSDFITAVWPIAIVWTLNMKLRRKLFLGTLFALTIV